MLKRFISALLTVMFLLAAIPHELAFADGGDETLTLKNNYIKVTVNKENGGYVISTVDGDILKKSDNNVLLMHRGEGFDTSFTSFKLDSAEYVFGNQYGFFSTGASEVDTRLSDNNEYIVSTWSVDGFTFEQKISLVNNEASEQLGTAMITYSVKNNSSSQKSVKSRILIDTQLGERDYGYYEVPNQKLGQGYTYFEYEKTWDSSVDPTVIMPSDYFVRDNPYSSEIVGFGVNSVFEDKKPYKMTFAHWANIASTVFDYEPDENLNLTNNLNDKKTADSAAALYYDLGTLDANEEKSFSTYYGVTANLKNKDNKIIINTTAPAKMELNDSKTAYIGSDKTDNVARINVTLTNPQFAGKDYKNLAVVAYALGFDTQRQTDMGTWIEYDNSDPIYTEILDFKSGENRVTYFDFKFSPKERAQLGTFVIKVFDMDESVNELGHYAEEFCLASTENHIILSGKDENLPAVTLTSIGPDIIYNQDMRYLTVTGRGMEFFKTSSLEKILLKGENGTNYEIPAENLIYEQGDNPKSVSILLEDYMETGKYGLHFLWSDPPQGVPQDLTSDAMTVTVSNDVKYSNAFYGVVTVQRDGKDKYKIVPYKSESEFMRADINEEDLLLSFRGDIQRDRADKNFYRLTGRDKDVNINHILNYHGDDLTLTQNANGSVAVLMDGKITTVGANTTVRNGTAAFRLNGGTEYLIPEYDEDGIITANESLSANQDYIELKWDNAFDILTTVGGFLIDMKYGVLGKIQNSDGTKSDIISFGGNLDLGFMTPGGAAAARQNTAAGARWTTDYVEVEHDDMDDGYTFGITFDEDAGEFRSQVKEKDVEPANEDPDRIEAGAAIHDILYGGKTPGYIGINMDAHITMPQIVKFLPNKIQGELKINTINGYNVGVDAEVETGSIAMALSFVVRSSPSGAPVPDKLYFKIGGFEPGMNIDGMGVLWVTGGGGGIDNLYETIYGKDGIPPLTVLLSVEFDITKILTGNADLELSLRSLKVSFDDLSLKMLKDAKFVDGGEVAVGWYPNFNLNLSAGVNFFQIMNGRLTITAAAGKGTADFVQFVLSVAITLPKYIPIIGGMELASAELGGGSQKVWGSVEMLGLIKVGFTYYWGGSIGFTHGNPSGSQDFATLSATDDMGIRRMKARYNEMLKPIEVGKDNVNGETQFASIGGNLSYSAGSKAVADFDARLKNSHISLMGAGNAQTEIITDTDRKKHLVSFGEESDYILSVSRADGGDITAEDMKKAMSVTHDGNPYELRYYTAPEKGASDAEKREALKNANVNVTNNALYIAVPKSDISKKLLIEFSDGNAYDVSAIKVNPISSVSSCSSSLNGNNLTVNWDGEFSDSAKIVISMTDGDEDNAVILNENEISAKSKTATVAIPDKTPSGKYKIKLTLSDEEKCFESYDAGTVEAINGLAPSAPENVLMENCGDDKLKITVNTNEKNFDGYLIEVYEDGKLINTGLYFDKDEEITVGGKYDMPVFDKDGNKTGVKQVGYTDGKSYTAKVRLCNVKATPDGEIYYSSAYKLSDSVILKKSTPPVITVDYDKIRGAVSIKSDVPVSGELYINSNTKNGKWYDLSEKKIEHLQEVAFSDGDYTAEIYAVDGDGDHAIVSQIISIDTTAPVIMLSSPLSGECFKGESITVTGIADEDAEYTFKLNGQTVLPSESDIFTNGILKCTLPLGELKNTAEINLEISASDKSGNQTVKNVALTNEKLSEITKINVESTDKEIKNGKLTLPERESAQLKVTGTLKNGEKIDITDAKATTLDITGGTSVTLDGAGITAQYAGQALVKASFALGGNDSLYDGIVIETTESSLDFSALDDIIAEAQAKDKDDYTDESWNKLQNVIDGALSLKNTQGITQSDIDSAATAVSNAISELVKKGSSSSGKSNTTPYYTVLFNSNGGNDVASQKVKSGEKITEPEKPKRNGYTFDGWYTDKRLTAPYDFSKSVSKSFTLYAKWIANDEADWENPFTDVKISDWFYDNVEYTVKNGLFKGISETLFAPDAFLTRAMLVTVLYRAEGEPVVNGNTPFTDVDTDCYYASAVKWAHENGIVNGFTEDVFAPDDNITREQTAAIMYRYAKYKGTAPTGAWAIRLQYGDISEIADWAIEAVMYCNLKGIMTGDDQNMFRPKDNTTRAQTAAVMQRFFEN